MFSSGLITKYRMADYEFVDEVMTMDSRGGGLEMPV